MRLGTIALLWSVLEPLSSTDFATWFSHVPQAWTFLLAVQHHGSKTSSTEAFIKAIDPKMALFATGRGTGALPQFACSGSEYGRYGCHK